MLRQPWAVLVHTWYRVIHAWTQSAQMWIHIQWWLRLCYPINVVHHHKVLSQMVHFWCPISISIKFRLQICWSTLHFSNINILQWFIILLQMLFPWFLWCLIVFKIPELFTTWMQVNNKLYVLRNKSFDKMFTSKSIILYFIKINKLWTLNCISYFW